MKPLPRTPSGTPVAIDGDLYNCIADNLERMDKWSVQPPLSLQQTPAGNLISIQPQAGETVVVSIIGTATGSGYYNGSILSGSSNGGNGGTNTNSPATFDLQIWASPFQSQVDGPAPTESSGEFVNNALVVNLAEQWMSHSHVLYFSGAVTLPVVIGRVMGKTNESTPRTIVYINEAPVWPCIAKITNKYPNTYGGMYYGEIVSGIFASQYGPGSEAIAGEAAPGISGNPNCWITNLWEQAYLPGSGQSQLPTNFFTPGLVCGWPAGETYTSSGSTSQYPFYQVYTMMPIQSAMPSSSLESAPESAGMSASTSYTTYEQTILNRLVYDVGNIQAFLASWYANMKKAGYTL